MGKFVFRSLLIILILTSSAIIFLSYFGLETDKFDALIKSEVNEVNRYVKLGFQKTKIHLNLKELNLAVKLQNPKILVKDSEIILSKLDLFLPLRSFLSSDFLLERVEIAFVKNDIKDLTKISNAFLPRIVNKQLKKTFEAGNLKGTFIIPFKSDGSIGNEYEFSGKVTDATINLSEQFSIKNLTAAINKHKKSAKEYRFTLTIEKGSLFDLDLAGSTISFKPEKNKTKIKSLLHTNGKLNFSQIKNITSLFNLNIDSIQNVELTANQNTLIDFDLDKKFKVKNLSYSTKGDVSYLEIHTKEKKIIKQYLPEYDPKMILKNISVNSSASQSNYTIELDGLIKIKDQLDSFKIKQIYNYKSKNFDVNAFIDLTNSKVNIARLNYNKDYGKKSELSFHINYIFNKHYNIKNLNFLSGKTQIYFADVKLNKNLEVTDLKKLKIKTFLDEIKNNDFSINKSEKIIISGEVLDAQPILKSLYKKDDRKTFSKDFKSEIKINLNRTITGTNDDVYDFALIAEINKGSYTKLNLKGNFSENEIIEMSIYKIDDDKKMLQIISDRAKPFVMNFDFIKGFEGGKLEYESVISKEISNSNLKIMDFKVSKVPALAKLLTLASLQGIADTLGGEGINFEILEMKSNSTGNVLNIEEAYASGPAVSILLDGYVDKGKIVSLRGTLVPARWLNSIINKIPIVGKILIGKKAGEGVLGISFKMKGPPKNIKTTVNPLKTLTPRFIVRALEKMKKQKQKEETK